MTENLVVNGKTYKGAKAVAITNSDGEQKLYYTDAVRSINGATPDENGNVSVKLGVDAAELSSAVETALTEAKESGEFDGPAGPPGEPGKDGKDGEPGAPGANGKDGKDGYTPVKGVDYFDGAPGAPGAPGANGKDGKDGEPGKDGTNGKDGAVGPQGPKGEHGSGGKPVTDYGAKGDGSTDDTAAFQAALAANRIVFVPEGTYKLSGTLVIGSNCCLELAQSAVLKFTQTNKNCISMLRLASLKGNHATIFVPYTFSANVINCDTGDDDAVLEPDDLVNSNAVAVPPFTKWDPQWKMSRYVTDINICKTNSEGQHYSDDGACYGTAVYVHCNVEDFVSFMWGVSMSGLRIAGGFNYGIRIHNIGDTSVSWNHDMRIEAVIDACKIGVSVENCHYARLAVTIQPRLAKNDTTYAQHGIELIDSQGVDLGSSRVWDWNAARTLWTFGGKYQHIALIGECMGLILDDYLYYAQSSYDIRDLIYTDKPSNLEKMTILQEPIDRWFKVKDGVPHVFNGAGDKKLLTPEDLDPYFNTDAVKSFTDVLATATDASGNVYNGVGYTKQGYRILGADGAEYESSYHGCTGFIPIKKGQTLYVHGIKIPDNAAARDGQSLFVIYDSTRERAASLTTDNSQFGPSAYYFHYEPLDNGFKIVVAPNGDPIDTAYVRFCFKTEWITDTIMAAINEEIKYTIDGFLADGINVRGDNVILSSPSGKSFKLVISDSGALSTVEIE